MSEFEITDVCIVGAGIVGLTTAWQLMQMDKSLKICIIEKESAVGVHTSGRNSGVLHGGVYYEPDTLKARVCRRGAQRLKQWCLDEGVAVNQCGKVITPQRVEFDSELEILLARGKRNGVAIELIDERQLAELVPYGTSSSGRALWVAETAVVDPIKVLQRLEIGLKDLGVKFLYNKSLISVNKDRSELTLSDQKKIKYGHLYNCAGLHADRIAHLLGLARDFVMLPFRGNYWKIKKGAPFIFNKCYYPVPDLSVPFLGVHVTPSMDGTVYLGPTATPALGRENYRGLEGFELLPTLEFAAHMAIQFVIEKRMRHYIRRQALEFTEKRFFDAARLMIPGLKPEHIEKTSKSGIRPQLYNKKERRVVQDYIILNNENSTHVVNAISPAFSSSFELADHIIKNSKIGV